MISVEWFYWLIAAFFLAVGFLVLRDRTNPHRIWSAAFWSLLGLCFPYSSFVVNKTVPAWPLGLAVVAIACIAGFGRLAHGTQERKTTPVERADLASRFGNKLFLPVLVIPVVTGLFATFGKDVRIGGRPVSNRSVKPSSVSGSRRSSRSWSACGCSVRRGPPCPWARVVG